jgi:hypothetical protein
MEKNKTGKYFKYAIGEIILVVIGILIALSINNWNEERKERLIESSYVVSLIEDLEIDIKNLSILVKEFEKKEIEIDTVLTMYSKLANSYNETLWRNLPSVVQFKDFIYTDRTMQQLKNSGGMQFIINQKALNGIIDYDLSVKRLMESYYPDLNFYYENTNRIWFEIFDINDYESDKKVLSRKEMANGSKNYLLKSDKATLGKFNNAVRNFKLDITLIKETEIDLIIKAEQLIELLKKEYGIK